MEYGYFDSKRKSKKSGDGILQMIKVWNVIEIGIVSMRAYCLRARNTRNGSTFRTLSTVLYQGETLCSSDKAIVSFFNSILVQLPMSFTVTMSTDQSERPQ